MRGGKSAGGNRSSWLPVPIPIPICLSVCLSVEVSIDRSVRPPVGLSLSVCLLYLPVCRLCS